MNQEYEYTKTNFPDFSPAETGWRLVAITPFFQNVLCLCVWERKFVPSPSNDPQPMEPGSSAVSPENVTEINNMNSASVRRRLASRTAFFSTNLVGGK